MTTTTRLDTAALVSAIERRDADAVSNAYAADAVVTILDADHSPASPMVLSGRDAIAAYYRDICGRNVDHSVPVISATDDVLAFEQRCRYPDGNLVVCVTVASVSDGRITSQTIAQAWD